LDDDPFFAESIPRAFPVEVIMARVMAPDTN